MNPSDLYSDALSALTAVRSNLLSLAWQAAIDQGTQEQRLEASSLLIHVQQAILTLSNASLSDIASSMKDNEAALSQATNSLQNALDDISRVATVLNSISSMLQVVSKIVCMI
jgi:DNA repair ATPase RecN